MANMRRLTVSDPAPYRVAAPHMRISSCSASSQVSSCDAVNDALAVPAAFRRYRSEINGNLQTRFGTYQASFYPVERLPQQFHVRISVYFRNPFEASARTPVGHVLH